jgi:hypothetical protein
MRIKNFLGLLVIGLVITNQGITKQLSKSPFIPDDVYEQFNQLSKGHKMKTCGFDNYYPAWSSIDKDLSFKIKGYNSRMDNSKEVEGHYSRDVTYDYNAAITYAMVSEDEKTKERLFEKLYQWAKSKRLTETKQCYTNNPNNSILKECEGEWSDPDGQDLAPIKDSTVAVQIVLALNYSYNLFFVDYKVDDPRHETIKEWFSFFYKRVKPANDFYWGNSIGWYMPNIFIKHQQNKKYTKMVKKLIKGANKWTLKDGSFKDRTTRGNRALWYHHNGLGEAFMVMEMAYAANVKLPKNYEKKLLLAVDLFHKAYLDNSFITKWAKKGHNSQFDENNPDYQKFNQRLDSIDFDAWWFHVIQYRYPDHPTSKFLQKELTSKARSLKTGSTVGFGVGCIYSALANN